MPSEQLCTPPSCHREDLATAELGAFLSESWPARFRLTAGVPTPCRLAARAPRLVSYTRLPSSPPCLAAPPPLLTLPLSFLLRHMNKASLHAQVHTPLKKGGTGRCDSCRFFTLRQARRECATLAKPIRHVGVPESISNFRKREHSFP